MQPSDWPVYRGLVTYRRGGGGEGGQTSRHGEVREEKKKKNKKIEIKNKSKIKAKQIQKK